MATDKARRPFVLPPPIKPLRSLRVKVLLVVAGVALAPLALVGIWTLHERSIEGDLKTRAAFAVDEVADKLARASSLDAATTDIVAVARLNSLRVRVVPPLSHPSKQTVDANFDEGTDALHRLGTLFFGPDGAPSLDAFDGALEPLPTRPEIAEARARGTVTGCRVSVGSKLLVCHGVRVVRRAGTASAVDANGAETIIYVQESSRRAVRALYDLRYQLARLSLATIPFALLLAYWMGKRVVGPLEALRGQAVARAAFVALPPGDARAAAPMPIHVRGQDEITDLADAFDALVSKLTQRQGENERFVADLVHEFKNPVAAIRAAAEAMTDGPLNEARAQRLGKVLLDSSARLDALVSQFLELARAEGGLARDARSDVDVAALARAIAEGMRATFEQVVFEIVADGSADTRVTGVAHSLDSAVRNLLENAATFAQSTADAPATVTVRVTRSAENVVLSVTDSGPGIAHDALPNVFTRFFTTRGRTRGTGLGLALVRAIVEAHGGTVAVASPEGEGATFTLELPASASQVASNGS